MTPREIVLLLESIPLRVSTEAAMQESLEEGLRNKGVAFEREVRLSPSDRIDFLIGTMGVEMKTKGSFVAVLRQLQRYSAHERIEELLLFTTEPKLLRVPKSIGGKRVRVAFCSVLGGSR